MSAGTGCRILPLQTLISNDRVKLCGADFYSGSKAEKRVIQMDLELDDEMCTVMDYFEIFLKRMIMCRRAAEVLGCKFKLVANGNKIC